MRKISLLISGLLCVSLLNTGFAQAEADPSFLTLGTPPYAKELEASAPQPGSFPSFTRLARELSPAVVNISGESDPVTDTAESEAVPKEERELGGKPVRSLGSGFLVSEEGYIVTNNHVIDKAQKIVVRLLDDKTDYDAKLIGKDTKTDLALLKITPPRSLKIVYLGNSDEVEVGEWVIAIGNQFQLGQTVTAGIVSAKARKVPSGFLGPYDSFIQTDASINPGSSGGPLFNTKGQVIGINTAIFSPGRAQFGNAGGFNIGIGFAIPINLVRGIVKQLRDKGKVTRGMLGVIIQPVTKEVMQALGLNVASGALVSDVVPASPASKAGFKRRDVILSFGNKAISDYDDLPLLVADTALGSQVAVKVLRDGKEISLTAQIEELKEAPAQKETKEPKTDPLGLLIGDLTPDMAKALSLPPDALSAQGAVIVDKVEAGSAAENAGLARGDIIEELAGILIKNIDYYRKASQQLVKGKPALILVRRREGSRYLTITLK